MPLLRLSPQQLTSKDLPLAVDNSAVAAYRRRVSNVKASRPVRGESGAILFMRTMSLGLTYIDAAGSCAGEWLTRRANDPVLRELAG